MHRAALKIVVLTWMGWAFGTGALAGAQGTAPASAEPGAKLWVYVGTYTRGESRGIYLARLDLASGRLESLGLAAETANPSFLALHPTRPLLYAVGELYEVAGKKAGAISAFRIEPNTGTLHLINKQSSEGAGPCHLVVDRTGRHVLVANYGDGSVACLPIGDDGRLGPATSFIQHQGASVHPQRQRGPHAHSINLDPANRFALVADLGLDKVLVYRFEAAQGRLVPNDPPWTAVAPGAGPRHLAFRPDGQFVYVIQELNSTITALRYDAASGRLEHVQTISTLPEGFSGTNYTAEVQVHPSGKFLYGSNRGHDSIACFAIDAQSGRLELLGAEPSRGKTPRNFGIDPTGAYLVVANQDTGNVAVFRIDPQSGRLRASGHEASIPFPVCVKMLRPVGGME